MIDKNTRKFEFGGDMMNKRELIYIAILTLIIAFMDITGIPSAFFVNIQIADIEPFYFTLMINFILIGIIAYLYLKILCPNWRLGLGKIGLVDGLKLWSNWSRYRNSRICGFLCWFNAIRPSAICCKSAS